ncbi:MAG: alginate lyase family protein [Gemmatimonadota bacterium]
MDQPVAERPPRVFALDGAHLLCLRRRVYDGDPALARADERLLQEAGEAADAGPFSVMDKEPLPPSGDRHDYLSYGPYWWPDPARPDGLPYVRRDGEVNPDSERGDRRALGELVGAVRTLALAYFYSDHEPYAERAALLLRTWFLHEATRMSPNLEYGQAIPGRCAGRGIGIIDTRELGALVDAVGLLAGSPAWTADDEAGLRAWASAFLDWLLTSAHGRYESSQANNHGTWYEVQVLSLALFVDRAECGRNAAEGRVFERLRAQVEPDGSQPLELARTRSLSYSAMNLQGFFELADLAAHYGVDLWQYQSADGRSLRRATAWLLDRALGAGPWPAEQITEFDPTHLVPLLRRAGVAWGLPAFEERAGQIAGVNAAADRSLLLYAVPAAAR